MAMKLTTLRKTIFLIKMILWKPYKEVWIAKLPPYVKDSSYNINMVLSEDMDFLIIFKQDWARKKIYI